MRYSLIRKIHLYIALILAVPLTIISITGAILVYAPELQTIISPKNWTVEAPKSKSESKLSLAKIATLANQQRPDLDIFAISLGEKATSPNIGWLSGNKGILNINPYSGEILIHFYPKETFQGWVTALHRRLLVDGKFSRPIRHIMSTIALLLIVELMIGLWMWLKPAKPFERLAVKSGYSVRMKIMRLHQLTGITMTIILFFIAFTGFSMYWQAPTKAFIETITFSKIQEGELPETKGLKPVENLQEVLDLAVKMFPNSEIKTVKLPKKNGSSAIVTMFSKGESTPIKIWAGDNPLRVLYVFDGTKANIATWFWHLRYSIHVGEFAGPLVRFFWVFVAITPSAFALSGIWLYCKRKKIKK